MPENYVLLERTELNASAASVTFANIPQTGYTDLKIVVSARSASATDRDQINLNFNGLTTNQSHRILFGIPTVLTSSESGTKIRVGYISGNSATANTFGNGEIYIPNYTSANAKSVSADGVSETNANPAGAQLSASLWNSTAAITTIAIVTESGSDFLANSTFSLYGIAAFGTTPVIAPKASGGNVIATDGTYWYHAFTSSGAFVPQVSINAEVLVIAGGGGGGAYNNDGNTGQKRGAPGGAGGLLAFTAQALTQISYNVTVGAGGPGTTGNDATLGKRNGTQGVNSQFASLTASVGGGYGAGGNITPGGNGGSGGGGMAGGAGGSPTSGQGFAGGAGDGSFAGGGGGAGAAGQAAVFLVNQGAGGNGLSTYSSWGAATGTGQNISGTYWYAGGGGNNTAGNGGGGVANTNALANTGGGGGGDNTLSSGNSSGNGGSGIVIIRYPIA